MRVSTAPRISSWLSSSRLAIERKENEISLLLKERVEKLNPTTRVNAGTAPVHDCNGRRGQVRHWAHWGTRACDRWWEENRLALCLEEPLSRRVAEKIHHSNTGEKHIADVKTNHGVVVEFQHSYLRREERESREMFYRKMIWVVNGLRRKRDRSRFFASLTGPSIVKAKPLTFSLPSNEDALLRDWVNSRQPVYFDFGDNSEPSDPLSFHTPVLWRLDPRSPKGEAHLMPVLKTSFRETPALVDCRSRAWTTRQSLPTHFVQLAIRYSKPLGPDPLIGFERYLARQEARRRRF